MLAQIFLIALFILKGPILLIEGYRHITVIERQTEPKCSAYAKTSPSLRKTPLLWTSHTSVSKAFGARKRSLSRICKRFPFILQSASSDDKFAGLVENSPETQRSLLGVDWEHAISFLKNTEKESGVSPMTVVYNAAISSFERLGNGEKALRIYEEMLENRITPDLITFTAVMSACEKAFMTSAVMKLFEDLRIANLHPDRTIYGIVLSALATEGNGGEAITIFESLRKDVTVDTIDTRNYYNVIRACEKAHFIDPALAYYSEMKNKSLPITLSLVISLLSACDKAERWQDALSLYNEIKSQHTYISPNIELYNLLLSVLSKTHQLTHLQKIWRELHENEIPLSPNRLSFQYYLYGHSVAGDWKNAVKLLLEMLNIFDVKAITSTPFIFTIQACLNSGEIQEAERILQLMQNHIKATHPAIAYTLVMAGYASMEKWEKITLLYNDYARIHTQEQLSDPMYQVLVAHASLAFLRLGKIRQTSQLRKQLMATSEKHPFVQKILEDL